MNQEDQESLRRRLREFITEIGGGGEDAALVASLLLLGDRLVGGLDGIRARLQAIEDILDAMGQAAP